MGTIVVSTQEGQDDDQNNIIVITWPAELSDQ